MDYSAFRFTDLYNENNENWKDYKLLWEFLNTERIWDLLELSTEFNHPGVEGIGKKILEKFDYLLFPETPNHQRIKHPKFDRIKQMIGHMVKEIMISHSYTTSSTIKCTIKHELFTYGMRYKPSSKNQG